MENNGKFLQVLIFILCAGLLALSVYTYRSISTLQDENRLILEMLGYEIEDDYDDSYFEYEAAAEEPVITSKSNKISVSASYKMEDRYVEHDIVLPDILGDEEGKVIVDIVIDYSGTVKKTTINNSSTIRNEDVLEAARKAALKTDFNFNIDVKHQSGSITYIYSK